MLCFFKIDIIDDLIKLDFNRYEDWFNRLTDMTNITDQTLSKLKILIGNLFSVLNEIILEEVKVVTFDSKFFSDLINFGSFCEQNDLIVI